MKNSSVLVAMGRSAVGRAPKGALRYTRPEDLASQVLEGVLEQLPDFPKEKIDDLIEFEPQAFIDELAGSIKIHMSIVRQVKDQPSLTIAEFGDVPTKSILRVPAAASAAASK